MKNTMKNKLFIALVLLICLVPSLGLLLFGPSPLLANETAAPAPSITEEEDRLNAAFFDDLSDYIGSRFALRPQLVTLRSFLWEKLLHSSAEEQVIVGRDGELYYASTLSDYSGEGLSDEELMAVTERLLAIQETVEAGGGRFLFTVAPNKNSLIPEGMPTRFPAGHESSNYARLLPLLEEAGVSVVDLTVPLSGHPEWYYLTDSHWTLEGAAHAADALLRALGRESSFSEERFHGEEKHVGDLYQMLYPLGGGREAETVRDGAFLYETESDPWGGNAMRIRTRSLVPEAAGALYCRRDSFGIALYPWLAEAFETAEFSRSDDYRPEAFSGLDADVVILEIVERNLSRLLPD